jgi:imidazolonepropionase-like amidohydrolase
MAIALSGVAVWDGVAERSDPRPQTIRIEGERIAAIGVGPELARDARVIPLDGATAIPGLMDAHVHLTLDPERSTELQREAPADSPRELEARALAMLRAGITTARDLGGGRWRELELRDRIARGDAPGPRLLCAGQPVTSPRGHCWFWGGEARDGAEARAVVRRQLERGVDWLKLMVTGGMLTTGTVPGSAQFDTAGVSAVVEEAKAGGRSVAAHCHGTPGIRNAVAAGVATIEHCSWTGDDGFGSAFDAALADAIAERGVWVSPTVNAGWLRLLEREGRPTRMATRMSHCLQSLRRAGARFVASTDAGIPNVAHHRLPEGLAAFARLAALTAVETLRAATSDAAEALGLGGTTGLLRPGLCADVLVVDGDPTRDLAALLRPRLVVARGRPAL